MIKYPSIENCWKLDPNTGYKKYLPDAWSMPEFEYLRSTSWMFFEKIDGTNIRTTYDNGQIIIKGRTENSDLPDDVLNFLEIMWESRLEDLESIFFYSKVVTFYGEAFGGGIQGSRKPLDYRLFDIRINDIWLTQEAVDKISNDIRVPMVPFVLYGTLWDGINAVNPYSIDQGFTSPLYNDGSPAEGLVGRPRVDLNTRTGKRIIVKIRQDHF